jgi:hypothetical protein
MLVEGTKDECNRVHNKTHFIFWHESQNLIRIPRSVLTVLYRYFRDDELFKLIVEHDLISGRMCNVLHQNKRGIYQEI